MISRTDRIFPIPFLLFCIFTSSLCSQPAGGKWTAVPTLPILTNGRMVFADSLIGYYIGQDTGYVTKTGGVTWTPMTFPSNARPAPSYLFAPDHNNVISFQQYAIDSNGVQFPGVIKSTDMGSTWSLVDPLQIPQVVSAFTMWTANDGFRIWLDDASKKGNCSVTHNGGKTFTDNRGDATLNKYLSMLSASAVSIQSGWSDSLHGVIAVSGKSPTAANAVLLTSDGGRTWSEQNLKYQGDATVKLSYAYMYPGTNSIWIMPSDPKIAKFYFSSTDFGATWTTSDTIKSGYISKLAPVSASAVWVFIVGSANFVSGSSNVIAYKENSGKWTYVDTLRASGSFSGPAFVIQDLRFNDPEHGWVLALKEVVVNDGSIVTDSAFIFRFATSAPSGVAQASQSPHLRCVPNPVSSIVRIEGLSGAEKVTDLKLINTLGKQCSCAFENTGTGIEVDLRSQPNGCYFLTVRTSERNEDVMVMVVH